MSRAWRCSLLEDDLREITTGVHDFRIDVKPFEIVTLRLQTTPDLPKESSNSK
jgi:hypothetical protein